MKQISGERLQDHWSSGSLKGGRMGIWAPAHWGLGKIDRLLVPQGKASNLLTDHLITG